MGLALEKAIRAGRARWELFDSAKQAMIAALNGVQKQESAAEAELRSAPANVQTAMKQLFSVFLAGTGDGNQQLLEPSPQLGTKLETLGQNPQLKDGPRLTLSNYIDPAVRRHHDHHGGSLNQRRPCRRRPACPPSSKASHMEA